MALIKTGSPTTILKVAELEKKDDELKLKVLASRPESKPDGKGDNDKVGGTV